MRNTVIVLIDNEVHRISRRAWKEYTDCAGQMTDDYEDRAKQGGVPKRTRDEVLDLFYGLRLPGGK